MTPHTFLTGIYGLARATLLVWLLHACAPPYPDYQLEEDWAPDPDRHRTYQQRNPFAEVQLSCSGGSCNPRGAMILNKNSHRSNSYSYCSATLISLDSKSKFSRTAALPGCHVVGGNSGSAIRDSRNQIRGLIYSTVAQGGRNQLAALWPNTHRSLPWVAIATNAACFQLPHTTALSPQCAEEEISCFKRMDRSRRYGRATRYHQLLDRATHTGETVVEKWPDLIANIRNGFDGLKTRQWI